MADLIDPDKLKQIVEAALMAAHEPLTVDQLQKLFAHGELDSEAGRAQLRETLKCLEEETATRGYELTRVASGYRYQVRQELSEWVSRLWDEKPPRYSRALLETLALVAYKQPVTRGDIEQVRGVAVSQNIMRTLLERGWIRVVGQREVPGKPSLYATTREFLDYFGLKSLDQLPPLTEIRSLIEPLVMEEVAEEAREVAERDHPELQEVLSPDRANTESSADAGSEEVRSEPSREAGGQPEAEAGDGVHRAERRAKAGEAAGAGDGETVAEGAGPAGTHDETIGGDGEASGEAIEPAGARRGAAGADAERVGAGSPATYGEAAEADAGSQSPGPEGSAEDSGRDEGSSREEGSSGDGSSSGGEGSSRTPHSAEIVRLPRSPRR